MGELTAEKYRELFRLRAEGKLEDMECTKSLFNLLKKLQVSPTSILDVPCGVGHYYRKLRELGNFDYIGLDLDKKSIEMARDVWKDASKAHFEVRAIDNTGLPDNSIDTVICYNLLLHLRDYKNAVRELFRVTKKHLIIRSLFGASAFSTRFDAPPDYRDVYPAGVYYYNTYAKSDVEAFVRSLGPPARIQWVPDNAKILEGSLEKQQKALGVDAREFARGDGRSEGWKGLNLNYEVLIIEKE